MGETGWWREGRRYRVRYRYREGVAAKLETFDWEKTVVPIPKAIFMTEIQNVKLATRNGHIRGVVFKL